MPRLKSTKGKKIRSKKDKDKQLAKEEYREAKISSKIEKNLKYDKNDKKAADYAIGDFERTESTKASDKQIKRCQQCNTKCDGNSNCEKRNCKNPCKGVDPNYQYAPLDLSKSNLGAKSSKKGRAEKEGVRKQIQSSKLKTRKFRGVDKGGKGRYTTEPIPDYIMRAIQPKKSVHPVYGKLRY